MLAFDNPTLQGCFKIRSVVFKIVLAIPTTQAVPQNKITARIGKKCLMNDNDLRNQEIHIQLARRQRCYSQSQTNI